MNFDLKNPCKDCPFKEGSSIVLHSERAKEIAEAITEKQGTFTCHKTLVLKEEDRQHCAGAMIMLEHIERPNQMMRIAERLGYYDRFSLNMEAPVFRTTDAFIQYHKSKSRRG